MRPMKCACTLSRDARIDFRRDYRGNAIAPMDSFAICVGVSATVSQREASQTRAHFSS